MEETRVDVDSDAEDILALGRMVSYACQRAQSMKLEFSTYCLEMALTSLIQDINNAGAKFSSASSPPAGFAPTGIH